MAPERSSAAARFERKRGVLPVEAYTQLYPFDDAITAMADSIAARTCKAVIQVQAT